MSELQCTWPQEKFAWDLENTKEAAAIFFTFWKIGGGCQALWYLMHIIADLLAHLVGVGQHPNYSSSSSCDISSNFSASWAKDICSSITKSARYTCRFQIIEVIYGGVMRDRCRLNFFLAVSRLFLTLFLFVFPPQLLVCQTYNDFKPNTRFRATDCSTSNHNCIRLNPCKSLILYHSYFCLSGFTLTTITVAIYPLVKNYKFKCNCWVFKGKHYRNRNIMTQGFSIQDSY